MCALCGVLSTSHWAERDSGRRERVFRVRLLNRVLSHFALELGDWSGRVYVLRDRKGKTVVVGDLGGLWTAAEALAGRPLDPLDPALVAARWLSASRSSSSPASSGAERRPFSRACSAGPSSARRP